MQAPFSTMWRHVSGLRWVRWLFQDIPRTYAFAYLAGIIVFGLLYTWYTSVTPDGFYAPYAQYDPDLTFDRRALAPILQTAIIRAYEDAVRLKYGDGIPQGGPTKENFLVGTGAVGPQPAFTINWLGSSPYPRGRGKYPWPLVTVTIQKIVPAPPRSKAMIRIAVDQIPLVRTDVRAIRQNFFETIFDNKTEYDLPLEPDEVDKIENYLLGVQGRTASYRNNIGRMFYLSAVVQTTLGLGDLVPMTSFARGIVTAQAIFGIVIAGLFVNASTRKRAVPHPNILSRRPQRTRQRRPRIRSVPD